MDGLASLAAAAALFDDPSSMKNKSSQRALENIKYNSPTKRPNPNPLTPSKKRKKSKEDVIRDDISTGVGTPAPPLASMHQESDGNSELQFTQDHPVVQSLLTCLTPPVRLRCQYEWFYSTIDRDFFKQNEFLACLNQMGLHEASHLTKEEWSAVRGYMGASIGRPRRFSAAFVRGEQARLENYRNKVRKAQYSSAPAPADAEFPYQIYYPVQVGDCVTVQHTPSASLQRGLVLALSPPSEESSSFTVQLERADMGVLRASDTELAVHGEAEVLCGHERVGEDEVLLDQGRERVGRVTEHQEEIYNATWRKCLLEAREIHRHSQAPQSSSPLSSPPQPTSTKVEATTDHHAQLGAPTAMNHVTRVSEVCTASLLFLRQSCALLSPSGALSESELEKAQAVSAANSTSFLMHKISVECGSGSGSGVVLEDGLRHKLSMLLVLCQQTCTRGAG